MYEVLKDFAAPFATIVVAVFVGILTWRHNRRQTEIAQEKLKIDLFERRYAIYMAAREVLEFLSEKEPEEITFKAVRKWLLTIHEAPFFFRDEGLKFFEHVALMTENILAKIEARENPSHDRERLDALIADLRVEIGGTLWKMPKGLRGEMGFRHLE